MQSVVKATLADQVYVILRADIIKQNVKCGEKLTLKALQERFEISSTPIREAVNRLCQEGLVDHVTNIGAKVIEFSKNDIREIYDFCSCLDVAAFQLSTKFGRTAEILAELDTCLGEQEKFLAEKDTDSFLCQSDYFHKIFYNHADNSRLNNASTLIDGQFTLLSTLYQNSTLAKSVVLEEHRQIAGAIRRSDLPQAAELLARHLEHAKDCLLANI